MDAAPFLVEVGRALKAAALDAVLIGNAGAALQGAPVTTVDFDFLFRRTPRNLQKLKQFATRLGATVLHVPRSWNWKVPRSPWRRSQTSSAGSGPPGGRAIWR